MGNHQVDYEALKDEYETAVEEYLSDIPPDNRFFFHFGLPSFVRWLEQQEIPPPPLDCADADTAKRLRQYARFRERVLAPIAIEARPSVEEHFISFAEWRHGEEVHERYFGVGSSGPTEPDEEP